jgi:hypothetical protein
MPGTYRPVSHYPPVVLVAATPAWFSDNITIIALVTLVAVAVVVLRGVKDTVTRTVLLVLIGATAVFVYVNRSPLKACAATCECEIVGQDVSVPLCDPNVELSSRLTLAPTPV